MYLVDTPGVLPPRLGDVETGMKLALCGESPDVAKAGVTLLLTTPACEVVEGGLARAQQGLGKLGLDPLFQEPSVTTWWGRTSWPTTSCTP